MSAGFFRGTSVDQDSRWGNSNKKLLKKMKFGAVLDVKVNTSKVKLEVINKWVTERITDILGFEDDIVIGTIINTLEATNPDPKQLQIDITGFLEKMAPTFIEELWTLLVDAQQQKHGIPIAFIEKKKEELSRPIPPVFVPKPPPTLPPPVPPTLPPPSSKQLSEVKKPTEGLKDMTKSDVMNEEKNRVSTTGRDSSDRPIRDRSRDRSTENRRDRSSPDRRYRDRSRDRDRRRSPDRRYERDRHRSRRSRSR